MIDQIESFPDRSNRTAQVVTTLVESFQGQMQNVYYGVVC